MSLAQLGRFTDAATYAAEARRLADATYHAYTVGAAHSAAGILHLHAGRWAEARKDLEAAMAAYRSSNVVIMVPTLAASSAWMLAELGESGEALNRLRDAEALLEREATRGIVAHHGWAYHALGRTCLRLGRLGEARRQADRAIEACRDHHGFAAHAWHLRGEIATHADPIDAESGATSYRAALALAHVRGMRPLVARCHLGLATLYARLDKDPPAREHLTAAATMFREMDVEFTVPAHVGRINGPSTSATGHG
jgi:tetratricopeptide (TPR) repeat protein